MPEIVDALEDVERAVVRVEEAVKSKASTFAYIGYMLIGVYLWSVPGQIWHAKWRYSLGYDVSSDKIHIDDKPHDCSFLAAPLGEKYCHYERTVTTLRWATSTAGFPIVSYDEGKAWSVFTPDPGATVPKYSTVEEVYVSWEKKND
jgi:hypothetical protein